MIRISVMAPMRGFDLLAPYYDLMELVLAGGKLHRCRTAFLDQIADCRNILLVGEGHGRALVECCRRFPGARIVCLDASAGMLARARLRMEREAGPTSNVEFIQADVLDWPVRAQEFDLVVTNFFLDCFRREQLEVIIPRLAGGLLPGGNWLLSDFQVGKKRGQRLRSKLILWTMYCFFRAVTNLPARRLCAPEEFLIREGLHLRGQVESEWGLLRSDWWQAAEQKATRGC